MGRMLKLKKVAVTGGLSCGKSSACRFFKDLGSYVVSADEIVHRLLTPTTTLGQQIISLIGPEIIVNHQIDRSQIAKKVFKQPDLLQRLEKLLHPVVQDEIENLYERVKEANLETLFVVEIPLLFETRSDRFFDYTVSLIADERLCRERFKQSTGNDDDEYSRRMARQMAADEKAKRSDFVIINNGSIEDLRHAIQQVYKTIKRS